MPVAKPNLSVGIMQGRLSPPTGGRIQSFPVTTWAEEFPRAREAGLASIEWIYETGTDDQNPLRLDEGVAAIKRQMKETGVQVFSICADYYMGELLLDAEGRPRPAVVDHLRWLLSRASLLPIRYIVLPFVDASSLKTPAHQVGVRQVLRQVLPEAERFRIELHLETDLRPDLLAAIYRELDHPFLKANYDIGNSASLGFDPDEELSQVGRWLGSVHIKDRVKGGGTVSLGKGAADFPVCFRHFQKAGYRNPYILQVAREDGLSETALAQRNRTWVEGRVQEAAR